MKKLTKGITVINQLLFILKQVDKKRRRKIYFFGLISVFNAFIEVLFLNTFSGFISFLISIQSETFDGFNVTKQLSIFYQIIYKSSGIYLKEDILTNCILIFIITVITAYVRLYSLRFCKYEIANLTSYFESKCANIIISTKYENSKKYISSDIITNFNHINVFVYYFVEGTISCFSYLILFICLAVYIALFTSQLFFYSLFFIGFIYLIIYFTNSKALVLISNNIANYSNKRTSLLTYMVSMFRHFILTRQEIKISNEFKKSSETVYKNTSKATYISMYPRILIEYIAIISIVIAIIYPIIRFGSYISISESAVFLLATLRMIPALQTFYHFFSGIKSNKYAIDSLIKLLLLDKSSENKNFKRNKYFDNFDISSIILKDISFKYSNINRNVIENFSFNFYKGKTYAITGISGSGKSTLIDIIFKLLEPQKGSILINNKNILDNDLEAELTLNTLRENSLLIGQNDFYRGSNIYDFLEINKKAKNFSVLKEKLIKGINYLDLNNVIDKTNLSKEFGENASMLSGGQRQRVLLLKSLITTKQILIFDEATSALDFSSKNKVIKMLMSNDVLYGNRIIIFSTHSENIIKYCDEVINLS